MPRPTRPFTVEIKRRKFGAPATSPQKPAPTSGSELSEFLVMEAPTSRASAGSRGDAVMLAADALFRRSPEERVASAHVASHDEQPRRRVLSDLTAKDPLEELLRARAEERRERRHRASKAVIGSVATVKNA